MFLVGIFDSVDINNTGKLFSPLKAWRLFSLRKCQVFKNQISGITWFIQKGVDRGGGWGYLFK